jgi:hypothetical protein
MEERGRTADYVGRGKDHCGTDEAGVVDEISDSLVSAGDMFGREMLTCASALLLSEPQLFLFSSILRYTSLREEQHLPDVNCRFRTSLFRTRVCACFKAAVVVDRPSERNDEYRQMFDVVEVALSPLASKTQGRESSSRVTDSTWRDRSFNLIFGAMNRSLHAISHVSTSDKN